MKISVVIVSYNTKKLLKDCLDSLYDKVQNVEFEIIVVDNASSDDSPQMVKKFFPKVILVESPNNLGFAAGNNLGLRKTKGEYILLLNSDTIMVENSLIKMVNFMEQNSKIGIASCKLVDIDGKVQPSGGFFPSLGRVFAWMLFLDDLPFVGSLIHPFHPHNPDFYTKDKWYDQLHFQDWVTGAFFLVRQKVFRDIGVLDENFFMYVEEMEFCYRAKKAGWGIAYTPETKVIHLGAQSGSNKGAVLGEYKGLRYFFAKHRSSIEMPFLRILLKVGAALRILLFGIMKRNWEIKTTYVEAFRAA